jgi:hypothetical protein
MQGQPATNGDVIGLVVLLVCLVAIGWLCRKWFLQGYRRNPLPASQAWKWIDDTGALVKITALVFLYTVFLFAMWIVGIVVALAIIIWAFRTVFG